MIHRFDTVPTGPARTRRRVGPSLLGLLCVWLLAGPGLAAAQNQNGVCAARRQPEKTNCAVLMALYNDTGGANWTTKTNWNTKAALGSWVGVTADAAGQVLALNLSANNLAGSLPTALDNLSALTHLDLSDNQLSGPLPDEVGSLTKLTHLDLSANQLDSAIPTSALRKLTRLTHLDLSDNQFTGFSGGTTLGKLTALEILDLSANNLTGTIPDIGSLTKLTHLDLSANQLTGFSGTNLGSLTKLTYLNLSSNRLSGAIPDISRLDALLTLDLSANQLTGPIPDISRLTALIHLDLSANKLSGPIPTGLSNLQILDLSANQLTGSISAISRLTKLTHLDLSANKLSGPIPAIPDNSLRALQVLDLSANQLTGAIPAIPGNSLIALQVLDLSHNRLSGALPRNLDRLLELTYLDLSHNRQLSGAFPSGLGCLEDLTHLDFSHNRLSGPLPVELGGSITGCAGEQRERQLRELTWLDLSHNRFTGPLPPSMNGLSSLIYLDLSANQLSRSIPANLGSLASLQTLNLSANQLNGSIPFTLGGLRNLTNLSLNSNSLSGMVPDELRNLRNLVTLEFDTTTGLCRSARLAAWLARLGLTLPLCRPDSDLVAQDRAALVALYKATGGASWTTRTNWNTTQALGTWAGVTTNALGRVVALDLRSAGLSGLLPAAIGDLTALTSLNLSANQLSGSLPATAGSLTALTSLNLSNNQLSSFLPPELGSLNRLQTLNLSRNRLRGSIPVTVGGLTAIQVLDLSANRLSGAIPTELSGLRNLNELYLSANQLRGVVPDALGELRNLAVLRLDTTTGLCGSAQLEAWLVRLEVSLPLCRADGTVDRHGNTPETATGLSLPSAAESGRVDGADDLDYFRLNIPRPGVLTVETTGGTDTFGRLISARTGRSVSDDDGGGDRNFRLALAVTTGTWHIAVSGAGTGGDYVLAVKYSAGFFENPGPDSAQSGLGVVSGWACEADRVVVEFTNPWGEVRRETAAYGTARTDTAAVCGDSDNGFGLLFNWNRLEDGMHEVAVRVDGIVLGRRTVRVTTLGEEFPRGLQGSYPLANFPSQGKTMQLVWEETLQNFVLAPAGTPSPRPQPRNPSPARGMLENPGPGSLQSGIGVVSGWVCEAEIVELKLGGLPWQAAIYGTGRTDTRGVCGDDDNGFGLLFNWNRLGDGQHTVVARVDGRELGRATVRVTTLGEEFLRGAQGSYAVADFPSQGETLTVKWQEALQNFTITRLE